MNKGTSGKHLSRTIVAHLGARLHYGVAEALNNKGMLGHLFTDLYLSRNSNLYRLFTELKQFNSFNLLNKAMQRSSSIDSNMVTTFPLLGLRYWRELRKNAGHTDIFLKYNREFGSKVADRLSSLNFNAVYGFTGSSLEIFLKAREMGAQLFLEQMSAPLATSQTVIAYEHERWPGWQRNMGSSWNLEEWRPREEKEWELADHIIVPSPYVEDQLSNYHLPDTSITRIPYAISLDHYLPKQKKFNGTRKLRVLYVGDLRLLKGTPYLLQAIDKVGNDRVELTCVGNNFLEEAKLAPYRDKVHFTGPLPRSEVARWYEWADVMVMPSLCEGSAAVTYEAKVSGLPVIATFNSGAWLEDGFDGIPIPVRSSDGIAEALERFLHSPNMVEEMSGNAIDKRYRFGRQRYQENLHKVINENTPVVQ